jgi:hypothetical protein
MENGGFHLPNHGESRTVLSTEFRSQDGLKDGPEPKKMPTVTRSTPAGKESKKETPQTGRKRPAAKECGNTMQGPKRRVGVKRNC